jgi:hypothetical protein
MYENIPISLLIHHREDFNLIIGTIQTKVLNLWKKNRDFLLSVQYVRTL